MVLKAECLFKKPVAHRGLHSGDSECPENSLKAFERAMRRCFPFELDAWLLSDNNVCIFHDPNTKRMTGIDRCVEKLRTGEIRQMSLLGSCQRIPLLDDVLSLIQGKVPIIIELKSTGEVGALEGAVFRLLDRYRGKYALQSFNHHTLRWFVKNLPDVPKGQVLSNIKDPDIDTQPYQSLPFLSLFIIRLSKPDYICYDVRSLPSLYASIIRRQGIPIIGWTVQSQTELQRVKPLCDNIIFEGFEPEVK